MKTRRQFITTGGGAALATSLMTQQAAANPLIWAAVRGFIWPAIRSLGGIIVDGAVIYARAWVVDKVVDEVVDHTLGKLNPRSRVYKIAMGANRVRKLYGAVEEILDIASAVKMILEADDDNGETHVVWGHKEPSEPELAFGGQNFRMSALQLKLLHDIQPLMFRDLQNYRTANPTRAAEEKALAQALLVPQSAVSHERILGKTVTDDADVLTYQSAIATVTMIIRDKAGLNNGFRFTYDMKIEQASLRSERPDLIWATPRGGAEFTLRV